MWSLGNNLQPCELRRTGAIHGYRVRLSESGSELSQRLRSRVECLYTVLRARNVRVPNERARPHNNAVATRLVSKRPGRTRSFDGGHARWPKAERSPLPAFVRRELEQYLDCGLLCRGFAWLECELCHAQKLVAFSCKGRAFCPACMGRRVAQSAAFPISGAAAQAQRTQLGSCNATRLTHHVSFRGVWGVGSFKEPAT